jgi:hypothetical protein
MPRAQVWLRIGRVFSRADSPRAGAILKGGAVTRVVSSKSLLGRLIDDRKRMRREPVHRESRGRGSNSDVLEPDRSGSGGWKQRGGPNLENAASSRRRPSSGPGAKPKRKTARTNRRLQVFPTSGAEMGTLARTGTGPIDRINFLPADILVNRPMWPRGGRAPCSVTVALRARFVERYVVEIWKPDSGGESWRRRVGRVSGARGRHQ